MRGREGAVWGVSRCSVQTSGLSQRGDDGDYIRIEGKVVRRMQRESKVLVCSFARQSTVRGVGKTSDDPRLRVHHEVSRRPAAIPAVATRTTTREAEHTTRRDKRRNKTTTSGSA